MANRYWVGGTGNWDTTTTHWSTSSGGAGGASVPTASDSVFFDANSGSNFTVTINTASRTCLDFTVSGTNNMTLAGSSTITIAGNVSLPATGLTSTYTGTATLSATTAKTITTNGVILSNPITITGAAGTKTLQDALTTTGRVTLTNGTLNLGTYTLTCGFFSSNGTATRNITYGTGSSIVVTNSGSTAWDTGTLTGFTSTGTSNVQLTYAGALATTIAAGTATEAQSQNFYVTAGTYTLSFTGYANSLDFTGFSGTYAQAASSTRLYGNLKFSSTMSTTTTSGVLSFANTSGVGDITTNGITINLTLYRLGNGGTTRLADSFTQNSARSFTLAGGTLDVNSQTNSFGIFTILTGTHAITNGTVNCASVTHTSGDLSIGTGYNVISAGAYTFTAGSITINDGVNLSIGSMSSANTNTRSIAFGTGSITTASTGTVWNVTGVTGMSFTGNPTVIISNNTATAVTVTNTATILSAFDFKFINGSYTLTLTSGNIYRSLDFTGFGGTVAFGTSTHTLYGDLTLGTTTTTTATAGFSHVTFATGILTKTITSNGRTANFTININGASTTVYLGDAFVQGSSYTFTLTAGTFDMASYSTSVGIFTILTGTHAIANGTVNCASVTHTSGDLSIGTGYNVISAGTYTFTAGTITINDGVDLTASNFSSSNSNVRSIAFGTGRIVVTGSGTYWSNQTATNFSYTGSGTVVSTYSGSTSCVLAASTLTTNLLDFYVTAGTYSLTVAASSNIRILDFTGFSGSVPQSTNILSIHSAIIFSNTMYMSDTSGALAMAGASTSITTNGVNINWNVRLNVVGGTCTLLDDFSQSSTKSFTLTNGTMDFNNVTYSIGILTFVTGTKSYVNYGGTLTAAAITHTSGTVTTGAGALLSTAGIYTFTAGTLTINDGVDLTVGGFTSPGTSTRALAFGTGRILITATGSTTPINLSISTGFSFTGTSNLTVDNQSINNLTFSMLGTESSVMSVNVISGSSYSINIVNGSTFRDLNFTGFTGSLNLISSICNIYGNLTLGAGMATSYSISTNHLTFKATSGTQTITTNGVTVNANIVLSGTAEVQLGDALVSNDFISHTTGTFTTNNYSVTVASYGLSSGTKTINLGSSTLTLTATGIPWLVTDLTGFTFNAGTSTISLTSSSAKEFMGGGLTYYNLNQGGSGTLTISDSNTFNDITATYKPSTISLTSGTTQTVSNFTLSGTAGNLVTLNSTLSGSPATLSKASGTVDVSYLAIKDSTATGGATWNAPTSSGNVDNGGNTGWIFGAIVSAVLGNFFAFF